MSNLNQLYKKKTPAFGNVVENRLIRAKKYEESRKNQRVKTFNENRNILNPLRKTRNEEAQLATSAEDRITRFQKWKADRDSRRKLEEVKKKPAFVVGVVHHKIYSPIVDGNTSTVPTVKSKSVSKTSLRFEKKRNDLSKEGKKLIDKLPVKKGNVKPSIKNSNTINSQKSQKKQKESLAPTKDKAKTSTGLPQSSLSGRAVIKKVSPIKLTAFAGDMPVNKIKHNSTDTEDSSVESISLRLSHDDKETCNTSDNVSNNDGNKMKANDDKICNSSIIDPISSANNNVSVSAQTNPQCDPVFFSPYIVSSRGKSKARKEQQLKRGFSLDCSQINNIPTKDTIMKNLNISVEEEERTAQYFQFLLNREIDRLNELCKKWTKIKTEPGITEDGQYEINQAIGQTNLLINKKFERFRGLVADCEAGKGEMLVTCKDLQGFWDMMYIEIENCDSRFKKLEKLCSQGWIEDEFPISKPNVKRKAITKKKVASTKTSNFRIFLAQKKKKGTELPNTGDIKNLETNANHIVSNKGKSNKIFNVNYKRKSMSIGYNDNKFTPVTHDKKLKQLHKIQLFGSSKVIKNPLTIIKVSQMCKTPEIQLDDSISYVNSNQTPGKSILKQPKNSDKVESHIKSLNKVNFNDHVVLNEVPIDEETQTKLALTAALSRIDSLEFDNFDKEKINTEKKLTFDDNRSDDLKDDVKQNLEVKNCSSNSSEILPSIQIVTATPINKSSSGSSRNIERQNVIDNGSEILNETFLWNAATSTPFRESKGRIKLNISEIEKATESNTNVRVLRNRNIVSIDTPKVLSGSSKKVSKQSLLKENESPIKKSRKSSLKAGTDNKEIHSPSTTDNINVKESTNKRRSSRNIKLSGTEKKKYTYSTDKPTQPMISYAGSKTQSNNKKTKIIEDNNSVETSAKTSRRIRSSRGKKV